MKGVWEGLETAPLSMLSLDFPSAEGALTDPKDGTGCPEDKIGEHFKLLPLLIYWELNGIVNGSE